jgi:hypothetical protein
MKAIKQNLLLLAAALLLFSCKKDMEDANIVKRTLPEEVVLQTHNGIEKISPFVDIDATNLLLQYKNNNGVISQVIPPWGSFAATTAPDNVRFDHFTADGWVLVYNTFDVEQTNARPVLVLYNKFRGILRWWWWNDVTPPAGSNFITYALMIDGANTSMFNFSGEFAKINTVLQPHPFIKSNTASFNQGLLQYSWQYFDAEFCYDPNVKNKPQTTYSLALNGWATSTARITLQGDVNGTVNGTIDGSGSGVSLFSNLIGSITNSSVKNSVTHVDNGTKAKVSFEDKINTAVSSGLADALKSNLNKLASQGLQILSSPLSNVFSSIISSSISPQQKVSLNLAAKINLTGDISTEVPAVVYKSAVPGTARGDLSGYLPYYNEPLGAFSLSSPPIVRFKRVNIPTFPAQPTGTVQVQYLVDNNAAVVLNPAIANDVTMSPVSTTLIYMKSYSGKEPVTTASLTPNNFNGWAVVNNVNGNIWYAFSAPYVINYNWFSGTPEQSLIVRVAFTLTPKNGSPPVEISKLFFPQFIPG